MTTTARRKIGARFERSTIVRALVPASRAVALPAVAALLALGLGCRARASETIASDPTEAPTHAPGPVTSEAPTAGGNELPDVPIVVPAVVKLPVAPAPKPTLSRPPPVPPATMHPNIKGGIGAVRAGDLGGTRIV